VVFPFMVVVCAGSRIRATGATSQDGGPGPRAKNSQAGAAPPAEVTFEAINRLVEIQVDQLKAELQAQIAAGEKKHEEFAKSQVDQLKAELQSQIAEEIALSQASEVAEFQRKQEEMAKSLASQAEEVDMSDEAVLHRQKTTGKVRRGEPLMWPIDGVQVQRGRDWNWGDKDGGAGQTGITKRHSSDAWVNVLWDNGKNLTVRVGYGGKYDLKVDDQLKVELQTKIAAGEQKHKEFAKSQVDQLKVELQKQIAAGEKNYEEFVKSQVDQLKVELQAQIAWVEKKHEGLAKSQASEVAGLKRTLEEMANEARIGRLLT